MWPAVCKDTNHVKILKKELRGLSALVGSSRPIGVFPRAIHGASPGLKPKWTRTFVNRVEAWDDALRA